nr:hypothetical protein [Chromobacterium sp. ASV5]
MNEEKHLALQCPHCKSSLVVFSDSQGEPEIWAAPSARIQDIHMENGDILIQHVQASFNPCYTYHIYKCTGCNYMEMRDYEEPINADT